MAAVGRFVLRGQETFCLIRPRGEALALETLFLAEDVRSQIEIEEAVSETQVRDAELDLARQVIDSLVGRLRAEGARERLPQQPALAPRGEARRQEVTKPEPSRRTRR
jgi:DNA end-binding protein Ku